MSEPAGPRPGGGAPYRSYDVDGWEVLVGKAARDNDELTFRIAGQQDWWLHAAGFAGSHVIIRARGDDPLPRAVLEQAAQLAAYHSKARAAGGKVAVHVCRVADVRKPARSPAGQVQLRRWETVRVYAADGTPRPG